MAAPTTTTATAKISGVEVTEISSDSNIRIQELVSSTTVLLRMYFPHLLEIPNSIITCMNTWMRESSFDQFHSQGNSRHDTIVTGLGNNFSPIPNNGGWHNGSDFRVGYWAANPVLNLRSIYGDTEGFKDGLYAHGISACMGAYLIEGTDLFTKLVGKEKYLSIARNAGITIPIPNITAGNRVIDLFPDTREGRQKSILAGLIILDDHYTYWRTTGYNKGKITPSIANILSRIGGESYVIGASITDRQALLLASGSYLGGHRWTEDANHASPFERAAFCRDNRTWKYKAGKNTASNPNSTQAAAPAANPTGCTG